MKKYAFLILLALGACDMGVSNNKSLIMGGTTETQVQTRSYQTRAFDTKDKNQTMRSVVATLQDLGFIVGKADPELGTVTASKYSRNTLLKMTVAVYPRGTTQMVVRANAQYGISPVEDPLAYQDFFNALGKSMFLTAHEID